jgi:hypothetical protein
VSRSWSGDDACWIYCVTQCSLQVYKCNIMLVFWTAIWSKHNIAVIFHLNLRVLSRTVSRSNKGWSFVNSDIFCGRERARILSEAAEDPRDLVSPPREGSSFHLVARRPQTLSRGFTQQLPSQLIRFSAAMVSYNTYTVHALSHDWTNGGGSHFLCDPCGLRQTSKQPMTVLKTLFLEHS